jgi:RsiW-degrading membrane proteinase PrsW (M82 family)
MRASTLKGLIHAALFGLAVYEAITSETKARKLVNGAAAGWHAHAVVFHFFYEEEQDERV